MDYKQILADEKTVATLNQNMAYLYLTGVELSLKEKYEHFYFSNSLRI